MYAIFAFLMDMAAVSINQVGFFVQKFAFTEMEKDRQEAQQEKALAEKKGEEVVPRKIKPIYCRLKWLAGFLLLFCGASFHLLAIAYLRPDLLHTNQLDD